MCTARCGECKFIDEGNVCVLMECLVDPREYMCGEGDLKDENEQEVYRSVYEG